MSLKKNNRFFSLEKLTAQTFIRIVFVIVIFVLDVLYSQDVENLEIKISFVLVTIVISWALVLLIKYYRRIVFLLYLQIFVDLLFTTGLIFIVKESNYLITFLYLLSITNASIILFRTGAFVAAIASTFLTISVYLVMINLKIIGLSYNELMVNSIYNLIVYFGFATIISLFTENIAQKDQLIFEKELELKQEKQIKNTVIDNMYSGIAVYNKEMDILFLNVKAKEILGIEQYKNVKMDAIFKGVSLDKPLDKGVCQYEGKVLGLSINDLLKYNSKMVIFKDITHELKLEEKIKSNEKLAYIGQISASIAHEIRNPLASISASLQIIPRFLGKNPEKIQKLTDIGLKEITRLNGLITDFLSYARIDKMDIAPLNIDLTLRDVRDLYALKPKERLVYKFHDSKQVFIQGDENKIKQIIINLIKNGFEATESQDSEKFVFLDCLVEEEQCLIKVKDQGVGMNQELIKQVFDPFFTTKKTGTGLGLALVNKFISLHQGYIEIESTEGEGCEFILHFPIMKG